MKFPGEVLQCSGALEAADLAHLLERFTEAGAILLRGCRWELAGFEALTQRFCDRFHGVATRVRLSQPGDGYTSEVFRDNFTLLGHSEGTYRPWPPPPDVCFFGCVTPPSVSGGETLVIDGVAFARDLPAGLRDRFRSMGVCYESHWDRERWQAEFDVTGPAELQALLSRFAGVQFTLEGEALHLRYTTDALVPSRSGELAFANGILAHLPHISHPRYLAVHAWAKSSNHVYFGDGGELDDAVIDELIEVHDRNAHAHRWLAGDLLLLDNRRFMHGRRMTSAPCERVLVSRFGQSRNFSATGP